MALGNINLRYETDTKSYYQRKLYEAAEKRNEPDILLAIKNGANCNLRDFKGDTVLHRVMKNASIDSEEQQKIITVLKYFLHREKMPVDIKSRDGKTILHLAVKYALMEVVQFLIIQGADLDAVDVKGNRVIHYMVEGEFQKYTQLTKKVSTPDELRPFYKESVQFFSRMLSKKIKVDRCNEDYETALHIAVKRNLLHLMPILIQHTRDITVIDKEDKTVLHRFVEDKTRSGLVIMKPSCYDKPLAIDILQMMLMKGYSVNAVDKNKNTPLHILVCHGEPESIEIMLPKITNINRYNGFRDTLLHLIIDNCIDCMLKKHKKESVKFVQYLVSKGADILSYNSRGLTPVQLAVMRTNPEILQILLNKGPYLGKLLNGGNFLHLVCQRSNDNICYSKVEEVISLLVKNGCNINAKNQEGMTPIHLAAQFQRNAITRLAKCNADVNARDSSEWKFTPLQLAVHTNNGYSINTLASVGADVNARDSTGKTALHLAMRYKNNMAEKLLRLGAHVEVEDNERLLPLHYAIRNQRASALAELLKYGADINDIDTYHELRCLKDPGYTFYTIIEHWIKLKVVGLPAHLGYKNHALDEMFVEVHQDCLKEVQDLKKYKLGDSMSIYNLLHSSWNIRCAYTVNENFIDLIESITLQTKFPKYYVVILASYHEAVARRSLLEPAKLAWWKLTKILLPDVCVYRILSFLNNRDLIRMTKRSKI